MKIGLTGGLGLVVYRERVFTPTVLLERSDVLFVFILRDAFDLPSSVTGGGVAAE